MKIWLALVSIALCQAGMFYPEQVHLSWTGHENEMRVTWVTYVSISSKVAYRPILCPNSNGDWTYVKGNYTEFEPGFVRLQYIHQAVISDLNPDCYYEYYVGNGWFWSNKFVFQGRTPDYSAPYNNKEVKMIIFGDWGIGANGQYTKNLLLDEARMKEFLGILHIGDLAYDLHSVGGVVGDMYLNMIQPVVANFAYMTIPGNHEDHDHFNHYRHRFNMPWNSHNKGTGYFFSFDLGPVHFVMINTDLYLLEDQKEEAKVQTEWLKQDLEEANRNRELRPWVIAMSHHPLYCSVNWRKPVEDNGDCLGDPIVLRGELEDLFYKNKVDLFFQAHLHNYERNTAIYQNQTVSDPRDTQNSYYNPKATVYITSGNAGNDEGHNDPVSPTLSKWVRFASEDYGYGRLIAYNATHLYWEQFSAPKLTEIDHLWIIKDK